MNVGKDRPNWFENGTLAGKGNYYDTVFNHGSGLQSIEM